jgi:hypothetical protein
MHLPEALAPALPQTNEPLVAESDKPLSDLQEDVASVLHHLGGHSSQGPPKLQGELSAWLVDQYRRHEVSTKEWLAAKTAAAGVRPRVVAKVRSEYVGTGQDPNWILNGLPHGSIDDTYANSTAPFLTLSTSSLVYGASGDPYCLDGGDGNVGSIVTATPCYPSRDPDSNRDPMQHFAMHNDGTLRLYNPVGDDTLCVTNSVFAAYYRRVLQGEERHRQYSDEEMSITLQTCDGDVNQTFAYHGPNPGDSGKGNLEFGDVEFYLGVVRGGARK